MKVVVHDASILIDLAHSETVDAWFASGIETWTTNLIYPWEIDRPEQRSILAGYVSAGKLRIYEVAASEIETLRVARSGLSLPDRSALLLVKQLGASATLATGDRALRKAAERDRVSACGLLGLFDLMIESRNGLPASLPVSVAIAKLERLLQMPGCWLPQERCRERIALWKKRL